MRSQLIDYHIMFAPPGSTAGRRRAVRAARWLTTTSASSPICMPATPPSRWYRAHRSRTSSRTSSGWAGTTPWVSSGGIDFNDDFGVTVDGRETFGLSVFLRDGDSIYRSYFTAGRGVETLGTVWTLLDLTPLGRQEAWEDSPAGWPKTSPYQHWRRHDEYDA
jgi:predicted dithiol-disulfide oxidoreductase (DUF899 family)